ncbi:uncharacterized protein PG998_001547 [Apiospora kogelbergensis]|uniref:uncharacterized protein n=1 Tax=Apiospora kogelbergensis TaxID=1337665 RepID=UPI00312F952A
MDPVSAVGIAAAAAQFIGVGIKAARLCKEIRDNADSSTDKNKTLESLVREARESRKELLTCPPQRAPRRISDLATRCVQAADELLQITTWTEKTLSEAFNAALHYLKAERVCIFVDGLDEYVGDYDNLIGFLRGIQKGGNVKVCVSSRPEVPLVRRLVHAKQLRLQDFNYADIRRFAKSRIENNNMDIRVIRDGSDYIAEQIAQSAEGVFLWAVLVTQAAIQGAEAGDDADIILRRIVKTPKVIEEIFASMLSQIDEFYVESLMFYSRLMEIANGVSDDAPQGTYCREHILSVPVLTAARAGVTFSSDASFASMCQQTEWQVTARSAGLMEIRHRKRYGWEATNWKSGCAWVVPSGIDNTNVWAGGFPDQLQRHALEDPVPYPSTLHYETRVSRATSDPMPTRQRRLYEQSYTAMGFSDRMLPASSWSYWTM